MQKKEKISFYRIFLLVVLLISIIVVFLLIKMQIDEGVSSLRNGPKYNIKDNPFEYWGVVGFEMILFFALIFYIKILLTVKKDDLEANNLVLISSVSHLEEFAEIFKKANFWQKMFGQFNLPLGGYPFKFFSISKIEITKDKIFFKPSSLKVPTKDGLISLTETRCEINKEDIESIERYYTKIDNKFDWIRIKIKNKKIFNGDFLLHVSFLNLNPKKQTNNLYKNLLDFKNSIN